MVTLKRVLLGALAVPLMSIGLSACGDDGGDTTPDAAQSSIDAAQGNIDAMQGNIDAGGGIDADNSIDATFE